jgi:hypothetical protein
MRDMCSPGSKESDLRCLCGSLLARLVPGGVELKCRRCHRTRVVALQESAPLERGLKKQ